MNKERRKELKKVAKTVKECQETVEFLVDEEQSCYDNLPESLQYSANGEQLEENIFQLENIKDMLEDVYDEMTEFLN